ncbi:hypothetical protein ORV05_13870 [Amycolatopsis cynarae]|uniref:Uncharacterized protein n=1 Tax=Amycolatopsis cynarae TaxID=2995223 RepID=A0ABY7BA43_9PSEU|nr:hypothetical protein [Amycolatopsis sp. HUAS 11-8]WAL68804.1 hypothetical protein ORV05_13870 [Amycolatopsis sp. HUAS 11-8]
MVQAGVGVAERGHMSRGRSGGQVGRNDRAAGNRYRRFERDRTDLIDLTRAASPRFADPTRPRRVPGTQATQQDLTWKRNGPGVADNLAGLDVIRLVDNAMTHNS